jgi:integrase
MSLWFQELPDHLACMALFKVNTGLREQEVCGLKWDYEVKVPELSRPAPTRNRYRSA